MSYRPNAILLYGISLSAEQQRVISDSVEDLDCFEAYKPGSIGLVKSGDFRIGTHGLFLGVVLAEDYDYRGKPFKEATVSKEQLTELDNIAKELGISIDSLAYYLISQMA